MDGRLNPGGKVRTMYFDGNRQSNFDLRSYGEAGPLHYSLDYNGGNNRILAGQLLVVNEQ